MTGFPALPENQVDLANWRTAPYCTWAFHHVRQLLPSENISCHGTASKVLFTEQFMPVNELEVTRMSGATVTVSDLLAEGNTDGFMVVHQGATIAEQYFNQQRKHDPHVIFSVTKSVMGILAGILVDKGIIDPEAAALEYIPEAHETAWKDCTIRHILDMAVGINFIEDYEDLSGDVARYRRSTGWDPLIADEAQTDLRQYLLTLKGNNDIHGEIFNYVSPNTDFLGWIFERTTGKTIAQLIEQFIWQPMGAEFDAYMTVDKYGAPRAAGGLCITLRDMARFAYLVLNQGKIEDKQIIPRPWLDDIHQNGNVESWLKGEFSQLLPNGRYRSFWYQIGNENQAYCAIGIHGQWIYCDPVKQMLIVRQASQGQAVDEPYDIDFLKACEAIVSWVSDNRSI